MGTQRYKKIKFNQINSLLRGLWCAARFPTLLIAISPIFISAALAIKHQTFSITIFHLTLTTAVLLQLLANFANDYGDAVSGVDNKHCVTLTGAIQSKMLSKTTMHIIIIVLILLCLTSGAVLLWLALPSDWLLWIIFVILGISTIAGATGYTLGSRPYGYLMLGDLAVFVFFGLIGVLGSYYLFTQHISIILLMPATSCGLFAAAVLNINNMRDSKNDRRHGKLTLAAYLGLKKAKIYQIILIIAAITITLVYSLSMPALYGGWLAALAIWPLWQTTLTVVKSLPGEIFSICLQRTVMYSFVFNCLFALGVVL